MSQYLARFANRTPRLGFAAVTRRAQQGGTPGREMLAIAEAPDRPPRVNEREMSAKFTVTSDVEDRVSDIIKTPGIYLANFARNSIAFFNHQQVIWPIGKWSTYDDDECTVKLGKHEATGVLYYSRRTAEGLQAFVLTQEGILKAVSVGFNPLEQPIPRGVSASNPSGQGYVFPSIDLLEISLVGVPCHPAATLVREHLSRGKIAGEPISPHFRKALEPLAEPNSIWSHGVDPHEKANPEALAALLTITEGVATCYDILSGGANAPASTINPADVDLDELADGLDDAKPKRKPRGRREPDIDPQDPQFDSDQPPMSEAEKRRRVAEYEHPPETERQRAANWNATMSTPQVVRSGRDAVSRMYKRMHHGDLSGQR